MPFSRPIVSRVEGEALLRILRAVEGFEDALQLGDSPRLEDLLLGAVDEERAELLRQGLGVELDYRRGRRECPDAEEYLRRFPDDEGIVRGAFREDGGTFPGYSTVDRPHLHSPGPIPESKGFEELPDGRGGDASAGGVPQAAVPGYESIGMLGRDGMGVVYKALQRRADRLIALKTILSRTASAIGSLGRRRPGGTSRGVESLQRPRSIVWVGGVAAILFIASLMSVVPRLLQLNPAVVPRPSGKEGAVEDTRGKDIASLEGYRALDRALALCARNDVGRSVLSLATALTFAEEARDDDLRRTVRRNLAAWRPRLGGLRAILAHSKKGVVLAAISPDGWRILTADTYGTARLWDASTGESLVPAMHHGGAIRAVGFSPDGQTILTAGDVATDRSSSRTGGVTRLWSTADGQPLGQPFEHPAQVKTAVFRPDGKDILTLDEGGQVAIWDAVHQDRRPPRIIGPGGVSSVAWAPDGRRLLTGSWNGEVRAWSDDGLPAGPILAHPAVVLGLVMSPDGRTISTWCADPDGAARLWSAEDGRALCPPLQHGSRRVLNVAFSPDSLWVLTGGSDTTARLWDAATGQPLSAPMANGGWVLQTAISPDGSTIATGGGDTGVHLWDTSGRPLGSVLTHGGNVTALAFSPDGLTLISGCEDGHARLWDLPRAGPDIIQIGPARPGTIHALSPDGRTAIAGEKSELQAWDLTTGQPLGEPFNELDEVLTVALRDDGLALTGMKNGTARLRVAATGTMIGEAIVPPSGVGVVAFGPGGRTLLTIGWDGAARMWDGATLAPRGGPIRHPDGVRVVALSVDGGTILTGGNDGTARLWDAATRKRIGSPLPHRGWVRAVTFSPDGRTALTGGSDMAARRWDVVTGRPVGPALEHDGVILCLCYDSGGELIVVGCEDGSARVWDAATGRPVGPTLEHPGPVQAVAFDSSRGSVLTCSGWVVRRWSLPSPAADDAARVRLWARVATGIELDDSGTSRILSAAEWSGLHSELGPPGAETRPRP
jgi:WD40 repeat protein